MHTQQTSSSRSAALHQTSAVPIVRLDAPRPQRRKSSIRVRKMMLMPGLSGRAVAARPAKSRLGTTKAGLTFALVTLGRRSRSVRACGRECIVEGHSGRPLMLIIVPVTSTMVSL